MPRDPEPITTTDAPLATVLVRLEGTDPERTAEWLDTATEIRARQLPDGVVECDITIDGKVTRYTSTDEGETWSEGVEVVAAPTTAHLIEQLQDMSDADGATSVLDNALALIEAGREAGWLTDPDEGADR